MASSYYTPPPQVIDGDVAYAADVNDINNECDAAFILVESAIATATADAAAFAAQAKSWAEGPGDPPDPDVAVEPGLFSARKHRNEAATSAGNAATSASNAATSESNAASSASASAVSAAAALASEGAAATSASNAATSAGNAATSETNAAASAAAALASEGAAATSASNAATSETNAAASAAAALVSEGNAATSASNAATSASNAAISETNAATSAGNASTSATNSANSAAAAATSETNAAASETKASKWADEAEDVEVEPGRYSSFHWSQKAEDVVLGIVDDTAYGPSWDGDTTSAASKNALYDKIESLGEGLQPNMLINGAGAQQGFAADLESITTTEYPSVPGWFARNVPGNQTAVLRIGSSGAANANNPSTYFGIRNTQVVDLGITGNYICPAQQLLGPHQVRGYKEGGNLVLSFKVYAPVTGTYSANITINSNEVGKCRVEEFTVSQVNTWETKTITFPFDPLWLNSTGTSDWELSVTVAGIGGTGLQQTPGSWVDSASKLRVSPNNVNWGASAGNSVLVSEIKLEFGDKATRFDYEGNKAANLIASRSTTGTWTITGLTPNKPCVMTTTSNGSSSNFQFRVTSGIDGLSIQSAGYVTIHMEQNSANNGGSSLSFIPTSETVVLSVGAVAGTNTTAHLYQ